MVSNTLRFLCSFMTNVILSWVTCRRHTYAYVLYTCIYICVYVYMYVSVSVCVWEYNIHTRQRSAKSSGISLRQQLLNGKLCQLIRKAVTLRSAHSVPVCTKLYKCACICVCVHSLTKSPHHIVRSFALAAKVERKTFRLT